MDKLKDFEIQLEQKIYFFFLEKNEILEKINDHIYWGIGPYSTPKVNRVASANIA